MNPAGPPPPPPRTITFDLGAFSLMYGRISQMAAAACKDGRLSPVECAKAAEIDASVTKQILTPPVPTVAPAASGFDLEQLMKLLGVLLGAATVVAAVDKAPLLKAAPAGTGTSSPALRGGESASGGAGRTDAPTVIPIRDTGTVNDVVTIIDLKPGPSLLANVLHQITPRAAPSYDRGSYGWLIPPPPDKVRDLLHDHDRR